MEADREVELKLAIINSGESLKIIEDEWLSSLTTNKWQTARLVSTYYDTKQRALQKNQLTFRIRHTRQAYEATVKGWGTSTGGLHDRQEWNVALDTAKADVAIFAATTVGEKLCQVVSQETLLPLFTTDFSRTLLLVNYGGSHIEVAVDQGEIKVGELSAPLAEIELELKSGNSLDLIRLGAVLAERFQLRLEPRSKYYRASILAGVAADDQSVPSDSKPLSLLWEYFAKEIRFVENPGVAAISRELMHAFDKLNLQMLKLAAGVNFPELCFAVMDDFRLLFQPLCEIELIKATYQQLIDQGDITPKYHHKLEQTYCSQLRQIRHNLSIALQQGQTTPYLLNLWAMLLQR